jgi:hypothetical protein
LENNGEYDKIMRMSGNFTKKYEGLSRRVKVLDLKVRVYFEEAEKGV